MLTPNFESFQPAFRTASRDAKMAYNTELSSDLYLVSELRNAWTSCSKISDNGATKEIVSPIFFSTINDFGFRYSFQTSAEFFPNGEKEAMEVMAIGFFKEMNLVLQNYTISSAFSTVAYTFSNC